MFLRISEAIPGTLIAAADLLRTFLESVVKFVLPVVVKAPLNVH